MVDYKAIESDCAEFNDAEDHQMKLEYNNGTSSFPLELNWLIPGLIAYSVLDGLLAFFLNGIVIIIIQRKEQSTFANTLMLHLSIIDFISSLLRPLQICAVMWNQQVFDTTGNVICHLITAFVSFTYLGNTFILTLVCVNRYLYIADGISYFTIVTDKRMTIALALPWCFSIMFPIVQRMVTYMENEGRCALSFAFPLLIISIPCWIVSLICNGAILKLGYEESRAATAQQSYTSSEYRVESMRRVKKTSRGILTIWTLYAICCLVPVLILSTARALEVTESLVIYQIAGAIWRINTCMNPVIYMLKSSNFRSDVHKLFGVRSTQQVVSAQFPPPAVVQTELDLRNFSEI